MIARADAPRSFTTLFGNLRYTNTGTSLYRHASRLDYIQGIPATRGINTLLMLAMSACISVTSSILLQFT